MPCMQCGQPVQSESRFCPHCGAQVRAGSADVEGAAATRPAPPFAGESDGRAGGNGWPSSAPPMRAARPALERPRSGRMIAGVCAAFGEAYGWNVVLLRILLVVLTPLHLGVGFLAYVIAWIVIPEAPQTLAQQVRR